jgi:hypothetical protein
MAPDTLLKFRAFEREKYRDWHYLPTTARAEETCRIAQLPPGTCEHEVSFCSG